MASQSDLIRNLSLNRNNLKLKARVSRLYEVIINKELTGMEMLLLDEEGSHVIAGFKQQYAARIMPLLTEGKVFLFSNFTTHKPKNTYNTMAQDIAISIFPGTKIKELSGDNSSIPMHKFALLPFGDIPGRCDDLRILSDLVGRLRHASDVIPFGPSNTGVRRTIILEDLQMQQIRITLFGNLTGMIDENDIRDESILLVTSVVIKTYGYGSGSLSLSATSGSRVYKNMKIPETSDYFSEVCDGETKPVTMINFSRRMLTYATYARDKRTIQQLLDFANVPTNEESVFLVYATITDISGRSDWNYPSCDKHFKKVGKPANTFVCDDCCGEPESVTLRYRIELIVDDGVASTLFVLFDTQAEKLLKISAADLMLKYSDGEEIPIIPNELSQIIGESFIFEVEVTKYNFAAIQQSFTIKKVHDKSNIPLKTEGQNNNQCATSASVVQPQPTDLDTSLITGCSGSNTTGSSTSLDTPEKSENNGPTTKRMKLGVTKEIKTSKAN